MYTLYLVIFGNVRTNLATVATLIQSFQCSRFILCPMSHLYHYGEIRSHVRLSLVTGANVLFPHVSYLLPPSPCRCVFCVAVFFFANCFLEFCCLICVFESNCNTVGWQYNVYQKETPNMMFWSELWPEDVVFVHLEKIWLRFLFQISISHRLVSFPFLFLRPWSTTNEGGKGRERAVRTEQSALKRMLSSFPQTGWELSYLWGLALLSLSLLNISPRNPPWLYRQECMQNTCSSILVQTLNHVRIINAISFLPFRSLDFYLEGKVNCLRIK